TPPPTKERSPSSSTALCDHRPLFKINFG
ncbi:hypothetical protein A2U01_0066851, partial [Trifolium medium]|nr:hypothetical protein [Trifolium medium]